MNVRLCDHAFTYIAHFLICSLDDLFSKVSVADLQDEQAIVKMIRFLETRIQKKDLLQEDLHEKRMNDPLFIFQCLDL